MRGYVVEQRQSRERFVFIPEKNVLIGISRMGPVLRLLSAEFVNEIAEEPGGFMGGIEKLTHFYRRIKNIDLPDPIVTMALKKASGFDSETDVQYFPHPYHPLPSVIPIEVEAEEKEAIDLLQSVLESPKSPH